MFKYNLGEKFKDKLTGFVGIIQARTEYLTGCIKYGLQNAKRICGGNRHDWQLHFAVDPSSPAYEIANAKKDYSFVKSGF